MSIAVSVVTDGERGKRVRGTDLTFRAHVTHEAEFELLQRHVEMRPDHVVYGLDLSQQIGRQRLMTDGPGRSVRGSTYWGSFTGCWFAGDYCRSGHCGSHGRRPGPRTQA